MNEITILKSHEMADELGTTRQILIRAVRANKSFPHINIDGHYRFIKEKVLPYWEGKKKEDIVPGSKIRCLLLETPTFNEHRQRHYLF